MLWLIASDHPNSIYIGLCGSTDAAGQINVLSSCCEQCPDSYHHAQDVLGPFDSEEGETYDHVRSSRHPNVRSGDSVGSTVSMYERILRCEFQLCLKVPSRGG